MSELQYMLSTELAWRLGWMILHSLWQGTAVAILFALSLLVIPRYRTNARYFAACSSLVAIVLLSVATLIMTAPRDQADASPLASVEVPAPGASLGNAGSQLVGNLDAGLVASDSPPGVATAEGLAEGRSTRSWRDQWLVLGRARLAPWLPLCTELWLLGVLSLGLWRLGGLIATHRLKRIATSAVSEQIAERAARLAARLRVSRPFCVMQSAIVQTPAVIGYLRPVILLPLAAATGLTPAEIEAILAHELAHIRRNDYFVNVLQTIAETMLFHHPAVWWISHRIRVERESCCDGLALQVCGDRLTYARALVLVQELMPASMRLAPAASGGSLLGRIRRIVEMSGRRPEGASRWVAGVVTIMLAALVTASLQISAGMSVVHTAAAPLQPPSAPRGELVHFPKGSEVTAGSLSFVYAGRGTLTVYDHADPHPYYRDGLCVHIKVRSCPQINRIRGYEIRTEQMSTGEIVATVTRIDSRENRGYGIYFAVKPGDTIALDGGTIRMASILSEVDAKAGDRKVVFESITPAGTEQFTLPPGTKVLSYCTLSMRRGVDERGIALEVLYPFQRRPAAADRPSRILHFPGNRSLGELTTFEPGRYGVDLMNLGRAQGDVSVPAGRSVCLTVGSDVRDLEPLSHLAPSDLEAIDLHEADCDPASLVHVAHLTGLKWLRIWRRSVDDPSMAHLRGLVNLETLDLRFTPVTDKGMAEVGNMHHLAYVDLEGSPVGDGAMEVLSRIGTIKTLMVRGTQVSDAGLAKLQTFHFDVFFCGGEGITDGGLSMIQADNVYLNGSGNGTSAAGITDQAIVALARNPRLTQLSVFRTRITGSGLIALRGREMHDLRFTETRLDKNAFREIGKMSQLGNLELVAVGATDNDLVPLQNCGALRRLVLDRNDITDAGLTALRGLSELTSLSVTTTRITDAGLASLTNLPKLADLRLGRTAVTDAGIDTLMRLPALRSLDVQGTAVTPQGLQRLQTLPGRDLVIRPAVRPSSMSQPAPVEVLPAIPVGTLDFRVGPNLPLEGRVPVVANLAVLQADLREHGPSFTREAAPAFQWFPVDEGVSVAGSALVGDYQGQQYVLLCRGNLRAGPAVHPCVMGSGVQGDAGWRILAATAVTDRAGRRAVGFRMDEAGGSLLDALTAANLNNNLAIVLSGKVVGISAVRSRIGSAGEITGSFTEEQVQRIAMALRSVNPSPAAPQP